MDRAEAELRGARARDLARVIHNAFRGRDSIDRTELIAAIENDLGNTERAHGLDSRPIRWAFRSIATDGYES